MAEIAITMIACDVKLTAEKIHSTVCDKLVNDATTVIFSTPVIEQTNVARDMQFLSDMLESSRKVLSGIIR